MTAPIISTGRAAVPLKVLAYGPEGVGKTTLASGAPKPLIIDLDRGSFELDVARTEPDTFEGVLAAIEWAITSEYQTIAVDSVSSFERFVIERCLRGTTATSLSDTVQGHDGSYGKGDAKALQYWREFIGALDRAARTKNVVLIGHSVVKQVSMPTGETFDKFELALRPGPAGEIKRWVNYILFARAEVSVRKNEKTKRGIAESTGLRHMYTDCSGAYEAKHRGHLPPQLPLSWDAFADAVAADRTSCEEKIRIIEGLMNQLTDLDLAKKVDAKVREHSKNSVQLAAIIGRLETILEGKEESK